jgi:hypothetical protein
MLACKTIIDAINKGEVVNDSDYDWLVTGYSDGHYKRQLDLLFIKLQESGFQIGSNMEDPPVAAMLDKSDHALTLGMD